MAVPYFAHEPVVAYSAHNDLYLLYQWGSGDKSESLVTRCVDGCTNGPPPEDTEDDEIISNDEDTYNYGDDGGPNSMCTFISYSKSLDGPWQEIKIDANIMGDRLMEEDEICLSNPCIYENGSLLMTWTQRLSWQIIGCSGFMEWDL